MKKNLLITGLIFLAITFTGCFNPIYYEINKDVAPAAHTINGMVRTIVRYTVAGNEYLVTLSDSGIKYKPVDITSDKYSGHGFWKDYSVLPENYKPHKYEYFNESHSGEQLLKIIGDSEYLYLLSVTYKKDYDEGYAIPDKTNLYVTKITELTEDNVTWKAGTWQKIENIDDLFLTFKPAKSDYVFTAFNIFSTNSVQNTHRKAYLRSGGFSSYNSSSFSETERDTYGNPVYYELNGTELKQISVTPFDEADYSSKTSKTQEAVKYYGCNSAVWINNEVKFFYSSASETNETYASDPTIVYYSIISDLYYATVSDLDTHVFTFSLGSSPISCLGVCSDSLLIGRGDFNSTTSASSGGITKTVLENGLPKMTDGVYDGTTSFTTNAEIKLKSVYFIITLLNEDPSKKELESNLFSSINFIGSGTSTTASFANIGLWAYYPGRGNWNCE